MGSKLGAIVRSDLGSGLQSQTYNLTRMLKPDVLLLVNSYSFNQHKQYDEMYEGFTVQKTQGWPTNLESARFMNTGLTHVITAETAYNPRIYELARAKGVKVFTQLNWEFLDHINNPRQPGPFMWLMPSYWYLEEMKQIFPNTVYLPPPVFITDFKGARDANLDRNTERKFVHIVGKAASHDRNGTLDLIHSLKYSQAQFKLVIRSQYDIPEYIEICDDPRVQFEIGNIPNQVDMYKGFDLMIMPRRYGGLCLPMNEALCSALPVVMPDISPNNMILPHEWLVPATREFDFMARTKIDVHRTDVMKLGMKLDWFANLSDGELEEQKLKAYSIGYDNYSSDVLKQRYIEVMGL